MSRTHIRALDHPRIRVLVVDDSVVIRNVVSLALQNDPCLEIVGTASNGEIALAKIPQVNPDVITLDIEMPEMDALEMLRRVRARYPNIFIIMFSTLSTPGAAATLDALMLGANDYVPKPSNGGSIEKSVTALREVLVPKIKQFYNVPEMLTPAASISPGVSAKVVARRRPKALAIGVSTGGPNALASMMPMLPDHFPYPIFIVQHMPPVFTRLLAERLQKLTTLRVEEATEGFRVRPDQVLIAPGGHHMKLKRIADDVVVTLDQSEPRNSCRPAVDVLFESVHAIYGGNTVAAVLTGMGRDGLQGAELLKFAGAFVVAQDEATSVVWGMPGFVARAGLADAVLSIHDVVPVVMDQFGVLPKASAARRPA